MSRLATELQGTTSYNDLQTEVNESIYERRVFASVIKLAVRDLMEEVKRGVDIYTLERYNIQSEGDLPADRPPKSTKSKAGRKRKPMLAPYAYIFGKEGTFSLFCQYLGLNPDRIRDALKRKILRGTKISC